MRGRTDGGSVELPKMWKDLQVQTSDGEEARAIGDVHSLEEQSRETYADSASAAESIWQAEKYYGRAEEELASKKPYSGCRICKSGNICGPCRLVEAFKLARNHPKVWHDIIYKDEDQTSAASQRRRSKLKKTTGSWDDIRWWQHDNKGSNWWDEWRRTYVAVTRIIRELKKNDEVQGAD